MNAFVPRAAALLEGRKIMMRRLILSSGLVLAIAPALARAEDNFCAGAEFSDSAVVAIGRVRTGASRVHFLSNGDKNPACPSTAAECQEKAYLVPGDLVMKGKRSGDFVCVDYLTARTSRSGWLPAASLEPAKVSSNPADWS